MHELSIAQSVLEIVRQSVSDRDLKSISAVTMKVGELAGVVTDSLEFSFKALISDTPFSDASLVIETVPFTIRCLSCGKTSRVESGFSVCPACSGADTRVLSGNELQVVSIELNEDEP